MENILLNSLNKKILALVTIVFFASFFLQGETKENKTAYMHEVEKNPKSFLTTTKEETNEEKNLRFLPIEEVERVLQEYKYERDYIQADSNFDQKDNNLKEYLEGRKSPLAEESRFIVIMSNKFGIDYRLLAAISIIESSGGRVLYRPYNAWGWGGSKGFTFENWEHSIYVVSKGLGRYYELGADTPEKMAPRYNPHTPNEWSSKVRGVMNQIGSEL